MGFVTQFSGAPEETFKITCGDTTDSFDNAEKYQDGNTTGKKAVSAFITCEDYPIRFAMGGTTPTQGGLGHTLEVGESLYLESWKSINTFEFINKVNGSNATIQVTIGF